MARKPVVRDLCGEPIEADALYVAVASFSAAGGKFSAKEGARLRGDHEAVTACPTMWFRDGTPDDVILRLQNERRAAVREKNERRHRQAELAGLSGAERRLAEERERAEREDRRRIERQRWLDGLGPRPSRGKP